MPKLKTRSARWVVALAISLLLLFFLAAGFRRLTSRTYTLAKLRQEPAVTLVYPGSINLRHEELEPRSYPLEGLSYGPKILDIFASNDPEEKIETFYREEMARLGWTLLGVETHNVQTSKELLFKKDPFSAQLHLWKKKFFSLTYPSLKEQAEQYPTIYRVLMYGPAK